MIVDAILGFVGWLGSFIGGLLPTSHLLLPSMAPVSSLLGKVDSLIPIAGPLAAAQVVLALVVVFVSIRLVLTLWNLIWP